MNSLSFAYYKKNKYLFLVTKVTMRCGHFETKKHDLYNSCSGSQGTSRIFQWAMLFQTKQFFKKKIFLYIFL